MVMVTLLLIFASHEIMDGGTLPYNNITWMVLSIANRCGRELVVFNRAGKQEISIPQDYRVWTIIGTLIDGESILTRILNA